MADDVKRDNNTHYQRGYEDCKRDMLQQRQSELDQHRLLTPWITLMQSLDRCEHGRHAIDDCFGTKDSSCLPMNHFLYIGQRLGTNYSGDIAIILPSPDVMHDPEQWKVAAELTGLCPHCKLYMANRYMDLHTRSYCPATVNPVAIQWTREGPHDIMF